MAILIMPVFRSPWSLTVRLSPLYTDDSPLTMDSGPRIMVTISTLQPASAALRLGRISPIDLLDGCLERIDRLEPRIHAWVFVDRESARADAERADAEMRRGHWRGPLHGIPLGIK